MKENVLSPSSTGGVLKEVKMSSDCEMKGYGSMCEKQMIRSEKETITIYI